jgi:cysteine desulfurase
MALLCYGSGVTRIYLDHSATSPLRPEARSAMVAILDSPAGNASSVHAFGHRARMSVETARTQVARLVGADPEEIAFTGGGTEANNLALYGASLAAADGSRRVVTSGFEHPSVAAVMDDLEERGFEVVRVPPGPSGRIDPQSLLDAAVPGTALVSLILANNEIGTLQPVGEIGPELRRRGILLHSDACHAAGKVPVSVEAMQVDLLSIAAHKLGGPQGVGALYARRGLKLHPHLRGGGQELQRRPGTENIAAIAGFGAAALAAERAMPEEAPRIKRLRDGLESRLVGRGLDVEVNGSGVPRIPGTSSIAFAGASAEGLVIALDLEGVAVSAGSACSAGTMRRSPTLAAMGLGWQAESSLRISLGPETTDEEIDRVVCLVEVVLGRLRTVVVSARGAARR